MLISGLAAEKRVVTDTEQYRSHEELTDGRASDCWSPQLLAMDQLRTKTFYDGTCRKMRAKVLEAKLKVGSHSLPS